MFEITVPQCSIFKREQYDINCLTAEKSRKIGYEKFSAIDTNLTNININTYDNCVINQTRQTCSRSRKQFNQIRRTTRLHMKCTLTKYHRIHFKPAARHLGTIILSRLSSETTRTIIFSSGFVTSDFLG